MKNSRLISLFLLAAVLASASCGGGSATGSDTTAASGDTTAAETEPAYDFGTLDMGGDTFTMLNTAQTYSFYGYLDFQETTGDTLDDSIHDRNRKIEEMYKLKIEVNEEYTLEKAAAALQTAVLAGDDVYDVAFIRDYYMSAPISEGYVQDLSKSKKFNFDEPWWDGATTEKMRVGSAQKIMFALTDVSLVDFEGTMVAFFNEEILEDIGLEAPYQLVKDGKWTFQELVKYQKAGANLNGDDAFVPFKADGNAIYGHAGFQHTYNAIIASNGIDYIAKDKDGNLEFGLNNEKFLETAIALSNAFSPDGEWIFANNASSGDAPEHYEMMFKNGRALFITAQLKASNKYRDMEAAYGILPIPKWDESQENYVNLRTFSYVMCVPVTNQKLDETAQVMDAMSYITYDKIMPYFYNGRLSQKNLRNDESVEMLNIIRQTRKMDLGTAYGMFNDMSNNISNLITKKSTDFASFLATIEPKMEANIEKLMAAVNE